MCLRWGEGSASRNCVRRVLQVACYLTTYLLLACAAVRPMADCSAAGSTEWLTERSYAAA